MAPLAADRKYRNRHTGRTLILKVAANAIPYQGGLVSENATGYAYASDTTAGTRVMGWSLAKMDNTGGADGAISVEVLTGVIKLDNDATNPIAQADVGHPCFVKDDHTVQNANGGCSVIVGRVENIDADGGIWVMVAPEIGTYGGESISTVVDASTGAGVPVVHTFDIADTGATTHTDLVLKEKFEVLDCTVIKNGAGAANTVQLQTAAGASNITDAIAAAVDKTVTRAGTIDRAHNVIAAGGTLRVTVAWAAGSGAAKVIVTGVKRA